MVTNEKKEGGELTIGNKKCDGTLAHTKKRKGGIKTLETKSMNIDEKKEKGNQGIGNMKHERSLGIDK
jgi:hypothetical protein